MTPPADAVATVTEAVPSLVGPAIRVGIALALLCAAAWAVLRWHKKVGGPRRQLEVLDRAFLARGASVALVRVGGKRVLLGVSAEGVRLLRDLDPSERALPGLAFTEVLAEATSRAESAR